MKAWQFCALFFIVCCAVFALWDYIQVLFHHIQGVEKAFTPLSVPSAAQSAAPSSVPQVALSMSPA